MNIEGRYSTSISADEKTYINDADYRDFIAKRIQDELSKAVMTALCTKDTIVVIKGDSTTRRDEFLPEIICRQDVYIKDFVQCKDCKHCAFCENATVKGLYCVAHSCICYDTDYCSWGERKEAE